MGPIVNREIKQRVRVINGLAVHRQVAKHDIKHAAKIIQNLDSRWKMWQDPMSEKKDDEKMVSSCEFICIWYFSVSVSPCVHWSGEFALVVVSDVGRSVP